MQSRNSSKLLRTLEEIFSSRIQKAFPALSPEEIASATEITPTASSEHGHYQCNASFKLAKILRESPRSVAEKLLDFTDDRIAEVRLAGPGFINMTLSERFLETLLSELLQDPRLGAKKTEKPEKVIVEFSSPNTAKELHVGHLRSTIIGDCLANFFEFAGHEVLRLNHVGDWGTPFGMLIAFLRDQHPDVLTGKTETDLSHLAKWYKESRKKFDEDDSFKKRSREQVVRLQSMDPKALQAWDLICDISRTAYEEIYRLLNVRIQERGESFYRDCLSHIVRLFEEKDLVTISDGAKCLFLPDFFSPDGSPLPLMIEKADGGYTYATTDLAALQQRIREEGADRILYVVDNGQSLHFRMFFKAAEMAGFFSKKTVRVEHVPFGLVLGTDGKKYKTRSGESEKLIDLLHTAVDKALSILKERSTSIPPAERPESAEILGINAIKYADLSGVRTKDYRFGYEKMLQFEGNTAAFLLYAYVRILAIGEKAQFDFLPKDAQKIILSHPTETELALHILRFPDVLYGIEESLLPNRLCDYLYDLANKFHAFFRDCRVIGSPEETPRLLLLSLTKRVFEIGFRILGLKTLRRM